MISSDTRDSTLPIVPKPITIKKNKALKDAGPIRARLVGSHFDTISAGTTKNIDWQIPQVSWDNNNKQTYFDGVEYYAKNAKLGDTVDFQIVDKDGIIYSAGTVVEEFATNFYITPNLSRVIRLYQGKLVPGLYVRIKYISTGNNDVVFVANILRHLDESKNV